MMLQAVFNHYPYQIAVSGSTTFSLESKVSVETLLSPSLIFWNTSAYDEVRVVFTRKLDFGSGLDPLEDGTFEEEMYSGYASQGKSIKLPIDESMIHVYTEYPILSHNVSVYNETGEIIIVRFLLTGFYDSVTTATINSYRRD